MQLGVWHWTAAGFPLKNVEGTNVYPGLNINECQELCEITQNCLYFVYTTTNFGCYMKYGLADMGGQFGPFGHFTGQKRSPSKLEVDYISIRLQMLPFKKSTPEISQNDATEACEGSKYGFLGMPSSSM